MTQQLDTWMIWKLLQSGVSLNPRRLERCAQLGLLTRVPTYRLAMRLGLPHGMVASGGLNCYLDGQGSRIYVPEDLAEAELPFLTYL